MTLDTIELTSDGRITRSVRFTMTDENLIHLVKSLHPKVFEVADYESMVR